MTVALILREKGPEVITISEDQSIAAVADLMAARRIGAVVVTKADGKLSCIISERDVVREIAKQGASALDQSVGSIMTRKVVNVSGHDTISHVMELMTQGRFRHLPVLEGDQLVGLISIGDVVKRKISQAEQDALELRNYIAS